MKIYGKREKQTLRLRIAKQLCAHGKSQKRHEGQKVILKHTNVGMSTHISEGTELVWKASGEKQPIECIYEGRTDHCFEVICGEPCNWV